MKNLNELIKLSQKGNNGCIIEILERFSPLINKYSRKLNYDCANTDLVICLLKVINQMPITNNATLNEEKYILGYINTSIKNTYITLSKKYSKKKLNEVELDLNKISKIKSINFNENIDNKILVSMLLKKLPKYQRMIIKSIFFENISETELAKTLSISRQSVNRTKNRALNNLKKILN